MYFPREFKDQRIAKLERQLAFADSLHKVACDDFYHLFKDELDSKDERIAELERQVDQMQERAEIYEKIILEAKVLILPESNPEEEVRYAIQDIEYIRECGEDY